MNELNFPEFLSSSSSLWLDSMPSTAPCRECGCEQVPYKHHAEERWLAVPDVCSDCQISEDQRRWHQEVARQRLDTRWQQSGVPRLPAKHALEGIELHAALAPLCALPVDHDGTSWGAYITGPVGTGKSTQAVAALRRYLEYWTIERREQASARYANVPKLLSRMKESFGQKEQVTLSEYEECGFLVLDDLGRENATTWAAEQLYLLVEARCNEMRPTVFTSNFSLVELSKGDPNNDADTGHDNYDARITSRIFQMCGGSVGRMNLIRLANTNYRLPTRH